MKTRWNKWLVPALTLLSIASVQAQQNLPDFLQRIKHHSVYVEAGRKVADARIAVTESNNSPNDPEIEIEYMPGIEQTSGVQRSYGITQEFSWPGQYRAQAKYNRLEREQAELAYLETRRETVLRAKLLAYELVYLRKREMLLEDRLRTAEEVEKFVSSGLEKGEATLLDRNNARMNLSVARARWTENRNAIDLRSEQLAMVAGFTDFDPVFFDYIDRPEEDESAVAEEAITHDLTLGISRLQYGKSVHNVAVERGSTLPTIKIGVAGERTSVQDSYLGIQAGVSIPLWGGSGNVVAAKAWRDAAELHDRSVRLDVEAEYKELVSEISRLKSSLSEYLSLNEIEESRELLSHSLERGAISVVEYLVSLDFYYNVREDILDLEHRLYDNWARLTRYRL